MTKTVLSVYLLLTKNHPKQNLRNTFLSTCINQIFLASRSCAIFPRKYFRTNIKKKKKDPHSHGLTAVGFL